MFQCSSLITALGSFIVRRLFRAFSHTIVSFIVRRLFSALVAHVEPVLPVRQCFCRSWRSDDSGRRCTLRCGYLPLMMEPWWSSTSAWTAVEAGLGLPRREEGRQSEAQHRTEDKNCKRIEQVARPARPTAQGKQQGKRTEYTTRPAWLTVQGKGTGQAAWPAWLAVQGKSIGRVARPAWLRA